MQPKIAVPTPRCRGIPRIAVGAALLSVLCAQLASVSLAADKPAREPAKYARWRDVDSFTAEGIAMNQGWHYGSKLGEWTDSGTITSVQFRFELKVSNADNPRANVVHWQVQDCQATGQEDYHSRGVRTFEKSDAWHRGNIDGPTKGSGSLMIRLDTGEWNLVTPTTLEKPYHLTGHSHWEHGSYPVDRKIDDGPISFERATIPGLTVTGNLGGATKPGVLTGASVKRDITPGPIQTGSVLTSRVVMWPNYRDVECVVEIGGYSQWLPAANLASLNLPGSRLSVKATLRPRDKGPKSAIRANRFRFQLFETSHEPGIAMNFPVPAKDQTPPPDDPNADIRLTPNGWPGEFSADGQKALLKAIPDERQGHDWAAVNVDAFDFGGYANLQVVCELNDGREIPGILKADGIPPTADITIPRRSAGSKIADSWREKYQLGLGDGDDLDPTPTGDGNAGDGFSNYEEYRGFVVNGRHVRTDPTRKDLFIRNTIGNAAVPGLRLFADVTELATHWELRDAEMPPSRVIDLNRSAQSPRNSRELQHGLVLAYVATGNASVATSKGKWRPRDIDQVVIQKEMATPLRGARKLSASQELALKSTVAHELCHAIGVKHHGETDLHQVAWVLGRRDLGNGQSESWFEERESTWNDAQSRWEPSRAPGDVIRIFDSDGRTEIRPGDPSLPLPQTLYVAVHGGECSGNDRCLMRYNFANAYVLPEFPRRRYFSPPEPPGLELCDKKDGTGINPQRYGDATTGGDCKHQFAVRDDAPELTPPARSR